MISSTKALIQISQFQSTLYIDGNFLQMLTEKKPLAS